MKHHYIIFNMSKCHFDLIALSRSNWPIYAQFDLLLHLRSSRHPSVRSTLYLRNRVMNFLLIWGNDNMGQYAQTIFWNFDWIIFARIKAKNRPKMVILSTWGQYSQKPCYNFLSFFLFESNESPLWPLPTAQMPFWLNHSKWVKMAHVWSKMANFVNLV